MKKICRSVLLFFVLTSVTGCTAGWNSILHDWLVWMNEVCDNWLKVTDEESATQMLKVQFKVLGLKREKLLEKTYKRLDNSVQVNDKDDIKARNMAQLDYYYEHVATWKRFRAGYMRLVAISPQNLNDKSNLAKVRGLNWQVIPIIDAEWDNTYKVMRGNWDYFAGINPADLGDDGGFTAKVLADRVVWKDK